MKYEIVSIDKRGRLRFSDSWKLYEATVKMENGETYTFNVHRSKNTSPNRDVEYHLKEAIYERHPRGLIGLKPRGEVEVER